MTTFDQILPAIASVFRDYRSALAEIGEIIVNRDLNGRIRLVVDSSYRSEETLVLLNKVTTRIRAALDGHAYPPEQAVLFEDGLADLFQNTASFPLDDFANIRVIDRLATESSWASIKEVSAGVPRVVFFSIKGGVGRSTALAAAAWSLAQSGKKVLVIDLDLESPGLSAGLLSANRRPTFGVADWLVEDLVGNSGTVFSDMVSTSTLSRDGDIFVVPAHGRDPGEYVSKLGRVWMPIVNGAGQRQGWSERLGRLINDLEEKLLPDVIFIDSRAGIDDIASSCVTSLGATLVLLFGIDGEQTLSGFRILFSHWRQRGVTKAIRQRLQFVAAMLPETDSAGYLNRLKDNVSELFTDELYDEVPPGESTTDYWNFDVSDESAPHYPWPIRWHRGFAALQSLHARFEDIDKKEVEGVFGEFIDRLETSISSIGANS